MKRACAYGVAGMLMATTLGAPALAQTVPYYVGPRALYSTPLANSDVPMVIRDVIQKLTIGSRLIAVEPRVIGGEPASTGDFPWMASIGLRGIAQQDGHFCGGAFIAPQWVVTAAHCVNREVVDKVQVLGGSNLLNRSGTVSLVDQIIVHERYDANSRDYDVALLHLSKPFKGSTIRLLTAAEVQRLAGPGDLAVVAGWGLTAETGDPSPLLHRVTVQFVSNKVCNGLASYSGAITDRMICAGFAEGGKDSCQGDSGGPLMVSNAARSYLLAGVVSFGEGCGRPNKFGVYTNVATIQPWIADQLAGHAMSQASPGLAASRASAARRAAQPVTRSVAHPPMPEMTGPTRLKGSVASSRAQAPKVHRKTAASNLVKKHRKAAGKLRRYRH